jgi:hypothetical protein
MIITKKEVRDQLDSLEESLLKNWFDYHSLHISTDVEFDDIDLNPPQLGNNSFYNFYEDEILEYQSLCSFYQEMSEIMYSGSDVENWIKEITEIKPKYMYNYIDWDDYCKDYLMGCEYIAYHPNGECFYEL